MNSRQDKSTGAVPSIFPYDLRNTRGERNNESSTSGTETAKEADNIEISSVRENTETRNTSGNNFSLETSDMSVSKPTYTEKFSGAPGQNIEVWLKRFRAYITVSNLAICHQLFTLGSLLEGTAKKYFDTIDIDFTVDSIEPYLKSLSDRFSVSKIFDTSLLDVKQLPSETVDEYIDRVQCNISGHQIQENILVSYVLKGLNASLQPWVRNKDPKTLTEVRQIAKTTEQQMCLTPSVRMVDTQDMQEMLVAALKQHTDQQGINHPNRSNSQQFQPYSGDRFSDNRRAEWYQQYDGYYQPTGVPSQQNGGSWQYNDRQQNDRSWQQNDRRHNGGNWQLNGRQHNGGSWQEKRNGGQRIQRQQFQQPRQNGSQRWKTNVSCYGCGNFKICQPKSSCPYFHFVCQNCFKTGHRTESCLPGISTNCRSVAFWGL
ncbi:hypothetical protein SNE40_014024 [Patella caerulea]|uniref:CCHC-type domain-containing protein n=1 Tax=Patella caerulea TaxID=87958 RepID=A0AAN8JDR4_PATCE